MNESENKQQTVEQEVELKKKSELLEEQKTLVEQYEKGTEELMNREFIVKIGTRAKVNSLQKFVVHELPSDYYKASGVMMLYSNIKQQKPFTKAADWDGTIILNMISIKALYAGFQEWKGKGAFETMAFLELLKDVAPELIKHIKTIGECQDSLRGLHVRLSEIDTLLDNKKYIDDCPETDAKSAIKESEENQQKLQDEIEPEV